jgi:thiol-disulfide isomerase/thioredoxin
MHKVLWSVAGLLTLAALVGVGHSLIRRPNPGQATASPTHPPSTTTPTAIIPTRTPVAPAFRVVSLNAGTVRVPTTRPTVVYFMSSSCGSCISGEQQLAHIAARTPATVQWLSLDVDPGYDTPKAVLTVARLTGAHWPQAFATQTIIQAYHVTQLDMVAVIAQDGALLYDGALPSSTRLTALIQRAEA